MRSLSVLPLIVLAGCTFEVRGLPVTDGGSRDLSRPADGHPNDLRMPMDLAVDGSTLDLFTPFDLAGFVCPGGFPPWHIGELTEGDATRWAATDANSGCLSPLTVSADATIKDTGNNSINLATTCAKSGLIYPRNMNAGWDLSRYAAMTLDIATDSNGFSMGLPIVYLIKDPPNPPNPGTYLVYYPNKMVWPKNDKKFVQLTIPLDGKSPTWKMASYGTIDLATDRINYVAVTWSQMDPQSTQSYNVWIDNLAFTPGPFVDCSP